MKITLEVSQIQIVTGGIDRDVVSLTTDIRNEGCDNIYFETKLPRGWGTRWVEKLFPGVPVDVIRRPDHTYNFGRKEGYDA